jgi:hypothetical protein
MNKLEEIVYAEMRSIINILSKRYEMNENEAIRYVEEKKRGRPKKEKREKGRRGRPRMEEKVMTSKVGEDLIERLIAKAKREMIRNEDK